MGPLYYYKYIAYKLTDIIVELINMEDAKNKKLST